MKYSFFSFSSLICYIPSAGAHACIRRHYFSCKYKTRRAATRARSKTTVDDDEEEEAEMSGGGRERDRGDGDKKNGSTFSGREGVAAPHLSSSSSSIVTPIGFAPSHWKKIDDPTVASAFQSKDDSDEDGEPMDADEEEEEKELSAEVPRLTAGIQEVLLPPWLFLLPEIGRAHV